MKRYALFLLLTALSLRLQAQKITFSVPAPMQAGNWSAESDCSAALLHAGDQYYIAWKEPGASGKLHVATGKGGTADTWQEIDVNTSTIAGPALVLSGSLLYLFWLDTDSTVSYTIFSGAVPGPFQKLPGGLRDLKCTAGITAAAAAEKIVLATHAPNKDRLNAVIAEPGSDGSLQQATLTEIKGARSATYPAVSAIGTAFRFAWTRSGQLNFLDYDPGKGAWTRPQGQYPVSAGKPPAVGRAAGDTKCLYIWSSGEQENNLQYLLSEAGNLTDGATDLPLYFDATNPLSIAAADKENYVVVFPGKDQRLYTSRGRVYDPASWMETLLLPGREAYTLKDIVLPGAHDAGMSVLSGLGGKSTYTINECNTLTQIMSLQEQLEAGIRMFDLRIDLYQGALYAKHAPSDCMDDAVGGGYGERLDTLLAAVGRFLDRHKQETVLLSFCHFCDRHMSVEDQARLITAALGKDKIFDAGKQALGAVTLRDLAGKVCISFEEHQFPELGIVANTMTDRSDAFFNYKRAYAATNVPEVLFAGQKAFFEKWKGKTDANDIMRLDWQLTQIGQEAALTCSQFQSEKSSLLLDGALLLTNAIKKNKSIISLARIGNHYLPGKVIDWIRDGTITPDNKPNILYGDAAGNWITDFCIQLNALPVYKK